MTPMLPARVDAWPASAPALAWPGGGLSYGELRAAIDALAGTAGSLGVPGSPLAVISASRRGMALGVLTALWLGRPALPLDPGHPHRDACLAACAPGGLLELDATGGLVGAASAATCGIAAEAGVAAEAAPTAVPTAAPALLVPTSGTSGAARVAMLTAAAMDAHVAASASRLPTLGPGDRWLVCLPMTSIGALAALWRSLSAGACCALLEHFDADAARRLMAEGASHVSVVPPMLPSLAASGAPPPTGLRCLLSGGGPLSQAAASIALDAGWPLWTGWGMTETASHVAVTIVDQDWQEGVVGPPLPGVEVRAEAPDGRLAIRGPMLMSGYATPGLAPGIGLEAEGRFVSSDLGESLADGRFRILGRADEVIVTGGVNVHPEAVERALGASPGVGEVAVTARPDARWGMVLVALYTGTAQPAALERWAREHLPSAWRPREFLRVASLPRNAMGKLLRQQLLDGLDRDGEV